MGRIVDCYELVGLELIRVKSSPMRGSKADDATAAAAVVHKLITVESQAKAQELRHCLARYLLLRVFMSILFFFLVVGVVDSFFA